MLKTIVTWSNLEIKIPRNVAFGQDRRSKIHKKPV